MRGTPLPHLLCLMMPGSLPISGVPATRVTTEFATRPAGSGTASPEGAEEDSAYKERGGDVGRQR